VRALRLHTQALIETGPLRIEDVGDPQPGPGEVRLRVRACALCRTDLHVIEGDLAAQRMPLIPGHQIVGVIDRLGPGVSQLALGDRIGVAWLRSTCGRCAHCKAGAENLCPESRYTGWQADGGYAELAIANAAFVYRLPSVLDDLQAAPLLCAGIIGYRALKRAEVPAGGRLGMFGFGSSAHLTLAIARDRGCEVFVSTRGAAHRDLARSLGAHWVGGDDEQPPVPLDGAILFAPAGALVPPALRALRRGGTLVIAGICLSTIPAFAYEPHLFHE